MNPLSNEIIEQIASKLAEKFDVPFINEDQERQVIQFVITTALALIPFKLLKGKRKAKNQK